MLISTSKIKGESGQSLVELLIAMGIFITAVSSISFMILNVYLADKLGRERTIASFLAREGMEAVRAIRDNKWSDLVSGDYGLSIVSNNWIFQGTQEDLSNHLQGGVRRIIIEEIDNDTRKITSKVNWELAEDRFQEVVFVTYLTNWLKEELPPQAENQAGFLVVDTSQTAIEEARKSLTGITISNSSELPITIDKITVFWDSTVLITEIKIENLNVWAIRGYGSPSGPQPSGIELDIEDFILEGGMTYDVDRIRFRSVMTGATFNITFLMKDGTATSTGEFSP